MVSLGGFLNALADKVVGEKLGLAAVYWFSAEIGSDT